MIMIGDVTSDVQIEYDAGTLIYLADYLHWCDAG